MILFLDTNIILDLVLNREEFVRPAQAIFQLAKSGYVKLCASDITFTTVSYYAKKNRSVEQLYQLLQSLRSYITIVSSGQLSIDWALQKKAKDFEDAVQYFAAMHYGVDRIITRNVRDYPFQDIPVITPTELLDEMGIEIE